ncbi:ABC transporter ATP-binding protein [Paenibacillus illinoisensis]|uniref:ABC transporter ATP-binding protein n=1 Tax=Paenibacillus illinoisensis TaxID=59845 RepID=UPI003A4E4735
MSNPHYDTNNQDSEKPLNKTGLRYLAKLLFSTGVPKLVLCIALILSIVSSFSGLIVPLVTGNMIDQFRLELLNGIMIVQLVLIFILQAVSSGFSYYLLARVGNSMVNGVRKQLWGKMLYLPMRFFDRYRSADLMSRVVNDTNEIKSLITDHLINFISNLITVIGALIMLFYLDWKMTLVIMLVLPISLAVMMPMGDKLYALSVRLQEHLAALSSTLSQIIGEMRLVKASNSEKKELRNGKVNMDDLYQAEMKEARINAILMPLMTLIMIVLLVVIIGYGGVRVSSGALTAGKLVAYILLLFQIMIPFEQFGSFFSNFKKVMGSTERLKLIMEQPIEADNTKYIMPEKHDYLEFREVCFGYESDKQILLNATFTIPERKVTAIVGPSGSGKTTIFSLIERFYNPETGSIYWGDNPIHSFSLHDWRKKIGYVSQESSLISGSIRENIIYGRDDEVSEMEMMNVARLAYAHDFIDALPRKYETEVGERGIQLSGGQRQRIAIARALLRNPDILLLDEATASLDSNSEHEVQKALLNLMQERTTIVIAHRLSTVVHADQIIVFDYGQVTGVGRHEELLQTHPSYTAWAYKQFQGIQTIN